MLGSRTAPVQEVLQDGHNGLMVDFFDTAALATRLAEVLADPAAYVGIRATARRSVLDGYPRSAGTAAWVALLRRLTQPYTYKHPHS